MPIQATITLDSGVFMYRLRAGERKSIDVGYFQSDACGPDIIIYADGEVISPRTLKLGEGTINILHTKRKSGTKTDEIASKVKIMKSLAKNILRREELYGHRVDVEEEQIECVLHFCSGRFRCSMVQRRRFKQVKGTSGEWKQVTGSNGEWKERPIAHNIQVDFELGNGELLRLKKGGEDLWSSEGLKGVKRLDIEIVADNFTAEKFYDKALKHPKGKCWLPNQGDPPPMGGP